MLSLGHMTKACALIGPLRGVLKKTLPGVGSFLESVSAQFEASEAFFILVTLHEKAKQKSSRGGPNFRLFLHCVLACASLLQLVTGQGINYTRLKSNLKTNSMDIT